MSSRALRKLQREQELQRQIAAAKAAHEQPEESEDEDVEEDQAVASTTKPTNAFDMLEDVDDEDEESDPENGDFVTVASTKPAKPQDSTPSTPSTQKTKSKKKKKKSKKKGKEKGSETPQTNEGSGDEIDRALRELALKNAAQETQDTVSNATHNWEAGATKLLALEPKNLNPVNEMKSLFGNIALEGQESRSNSRNQRRREQNVQGGVDLATALTGRYSVASKGKELGTLANRRNVFMQGKEEWPLATSGGLGMDHLPDNTSFEKRYNILHNTTYQETQMHFRMLVETMDPQRMIGLLIMHPYHIATLLQVSEIAKHQGDHSVSGDLLERALFSFGRSVHSSFPAALREGTARVGFEKPANRELYLTMWRYIRNLEMRGTWRTAFEWAKILLQLNTLSDPFGITLMIDQLALRGRQHEQLIKLASAEGYGSAWAHLPNIQISLVLAYLKLSKPRDARRQLAIAMHQYPYILSALASALDVSPMPKSLWAKLPSSDAEKLYTELYVTKAKDLWNTPENTALIVEVAETLDLYSAVTQSLTSPAKLEISLEEARHIMLLEIPSLIALLPRQFTSMPTSSSDVLPPPDSRSDFTARAPATDRNTVGTMQTLFNAAGATAGATGSLIQRALNWFNTPAGPNDVDGVSEGQAAYRALEEQLGGNVSPEMIEQLLRMHMHEADEEHENITAAGLGMAGDWDYYENAANSISGEEDSDHSSMPDLENESDLVSSTQPRNPRAAMVEEDDDDDDNIPTTTGRQPPGTAILRRVDSDDEDTAARESAGSFPPPQPPTTAPAPAPTPPPAPTPAPAQTADLDESEPQRIQRWLITAGLTELQSTPASLPNYVRRLKLLRSPQQDWIVNMVRQRAGQELADRIRNAM